MALPGNGIEPAVQSFKSATMASMNRDSLAQTLRAKYDENIELTPSERWLAVADKPPSRYGKYTDKARLPIDRRVSPLSGNLATSYAQAQGPSAAALKTIPPRRNSGFVKGRAS